jgi:outer membrane protein
MMLSTRLSRRWLRSVIEALPVSCESLNRLALLAEKVFVWPGIPISEVIASKIQEQYSKEFRNHMKLTLMRSLTVVAILFSAAALAQTGGSSAALPAAPGAAGDPPEATTPTGTKIGTINVEGAIIASNEGQRDFEALSKKLEPKQNELKGRNDEIEGLKKQLIAQGDKLNEDAKAALQKQIDTKQKALERDAQDARDDASSQESEIAQRILQKMAPMIDEYVKKNGFALIIDSSQNNSWPNGPVFWNTGALDITKQVVEAYNIKSGVPPPPKPAATTGTRPPGSATKPSAPATKPSAPPSN